MKNRGVKKWGQIFILTVNYLTPVITYCGTVISICPYYSVIKKS